MPNRIIKESAFLSDRISRLSDFEFRLWVGLITQADDAGRGDARPAIIKGHVFALRERVTIKDIDNALHALAAAGCVFLYTVDEKPYFAFPSWTAHQRVRDVKPKYPAPECGEMTICRSSPQIAADCRLNPNPNPNPNPITTTTTAGAPAFAEVHEYFKREVCFEREVSFAEETAKFIAYNKNRGWDCLPDWKAAADLWAIRAEER